MKTLLTALVVLVASTASAQSFRAQVEPTVKSVRAQYPPQVLGDQIGDILNAIAWQHRPNIKLLKKGGGGVCPAPQGVTISCDILIWAPPGTPAEQTVHVDVLSGASAEGLATASPYWKSAGPCTKRPAGHPQGGSNCEMKNALEPIDPGNAGPVDPGPVDPPPPPPPPPPPATDYGPRFDALQAEHAALKAQLAEMQEAVKAFRAEIQNLCFVGKSQLLGTVRFCRE